jgi:hypothetical protein
MGETSTRIWKLESRIENLSYRPRNLRRDLALQRESVGHHTIERLGPQVNLLLRLDELYGDAHAIAYTPHVALDEIVSTESAADSGRTTAAALRTLGRGARDDTDGARADSRQMRDGLLGQPIGEPVGWAEGEHRKARLFPHEVSDCRRGRCCAPGGRQVERQESIAPLVDRFDEQRNLGMVAKRQAQAADCGVEAVLEIDKCSSGPQSLAQRLARHHFTRPLEQRNEDAHRLLLYGNAETAPAQFAPARAQLEGTEPDDVRWRGRGHCLHAGMIEWILS